MNFHVITLFPEMVSHAASFGVIGQALKDKRLTLATINPRTFTSNVHQTVDDRPFGGGDGMIMLPEVLWLAYESVRPQLSANARVIHLSPRGQPLTDQKARELAGLTDLVLISSRYGGADQRFLNEAVDEEISIGDYVISGGELAALVVLDAVARHLPGVLGNEASADHESFALGAALEHPQYTRPRVWRDVEAPEALLSGHHAQIEQWKRELSILVTADRRPDLLAKLGVSAKILAKTLKTLESMSDAERSRCGLVSSFETLQERLMSL